MKKNGKKKIKIGDYQAELRGLVTNRHGGNQLQRERGLRGGTYGPASEVKIWSKEEVQKANQEYVNKYPT